MDREAILVLCRPAAASKRSTWLGDLEALNQSAAGHSKLYTVAFSSFK
jgi:hypothetical protein